MADLLHRLECALHRSAGASELLRSQVARIDGYMRTSRLVNLPAPSTHPNGTTVPVNIKSDPMLTPAPYPQTGPASPVASTAPIENQLLHFQLPPELLTDWPWPLDNFNSEGFIPLAFE